MTNNRFDGVLMAVFISIEVAVLLGVSAWAAGDLADLSTRMHLVILGVASIATVALTMPIWRRMLASTAAR